MNPAIAWGHRAVVALTEDPGRMFETVPLDRLLGQRSDTDRKLAWSIETALDAFQALVLATSKDSAALMARLAVPLADSRTLDPRPVDLNELPAAQSEFSPPSLYLCRREMFTRPDPFEQYTRPIKRQALAGSQGVVLVVYWCGRDPMAAENGWEYSRAVWFNFYPVGLAS